MNNSISGRKQLQKEVEAFFTPQLFKSNNPDLRINPRYLEKKEKKKIDRP